MAMIRALSTAASGMIAQQTNVDIIANNLANVNTVGFKGDRLEFKDALYQIENRAYLVDGKGKPVSLQVGNGVIPIATVKNFDMGTIQKTDNTFDFAIEGEGFFGVIGSKGEPVYTRDGSFKLVAAPDGTKRLTTSDGYPVLDSTNNEIVFNIDASNIVVSSDGSISYADSTGNLTSLDIKLGIFKFQNKQGLESVGKNLFSSNSASGAAMSDEELGAKSIVSQGFLESSNVQAVKQMVDLILAQRAYELNSQAIKSADEMLGMANNLRRG